MINTVKLLVFLYVHVPLWVKKTKVFLINLVLSGSLCHQLWTPCPRILPDSHLFSVTITITLSSDSLHLSSAIKSPLISTLLPVTHRPVYRSLPRTWSVWYLPVFTYLQTPNPTFSSAPGSRTPHEPAQKPNISIQLRIIELGFLLDSHLPSSKRSPLAPHVNKLACISLACCLQLDLWQKTRPKDKIWSTMKSLAQNGRPLVDFVLEFRELAKNSSLCGFELKVWFLAGLDNWWYSRMPKTWLSPARRWLQVRAYSSASPSKALCCACASRAPSSASFSAAPSRAHSSTAELLGGGPAMAAQAHCSTLASRVPWPAMASRAMGLRTTWSAMGSALET